MRSMPLALGCALVLALGPRNAAAQTPDGQALYREHCRTCHGADGHPTKRALGQYKNIPTFADSAFQAARSADSIVAVLQHGVGRDMKSFSDKLTSEEMVAVANYVKTFASAAPKTP